MKYMLDTNICIYAIKNKPPEVIRNFLQHDPDDMCISSITYGELMHGVEKSQAVEKNRIAMSLFLSPITILDFDSYAAEEYGKNPGRSGKKRNSDWTIGYAHCRSCKIRRAYGGD